MTSPRWLKELAPAVSPFLTKIFQQTLDKGELPLDWKYANVCPIFKSGSNMNPANYQSFSLT